MQDCVRKCKTVSTNYLVALPQWALYCELLHLHFINIIQCAYILHNYKLKAHDACVLHVQLQYTYVQHVQLLLQRRRPAV